MLLHPLYFVHDLATMKANIATYIVKLCALPKAFSSASFQ